MKLRNLFILNTVVALLFALVLLLVPAVFMDLFGFPNNAGAKLLGQLIGVELLVGGLVTYFARDSRDYNALRGITLANLVASVVGVIVSLGGILSGAMNDLGWVIFAAYLVLVLGFGYFQFIGPPE